MAQMFRKIILDFRYDSPVFRKYYHSFNGRFSNVSCKYINTNPVFENKVLLGYFLSERKFSLTPEIPSHQRVHICLLEGPLCSRSSIRINSMNRYSPTVSGIKHYSSSVDSLANQAIVYNEGIFKIISESLPVECIMDVLRMVHSNTGLPWWATIILTTFLARTLITLPFTIHKHQVMAKLENLGPKMESVKKRLNMEMKMAMRNARWNNQFATNVYNRSFKRELMEAMVRENCHPYKIPTMAILQIPLWVGFSFALKNFCFKLPKLDDLAERDYLELANGGFGWMKDLTNMDPTFILPVIFGVSLLTLLETEELLRGKQKIMSRKISINYFRVFSVIVAGIMAPMPSCLILFWTANTVYTILLNTVLMSPQFRRLVWIPKTNSELQQPYSEMYKRTKSMFRLPTKLQ